MTAAGSLATGSPSRLGARWRRGSAPLHSPAAMNLSELNNLLADKRFDLVESAFTEALDEDAPSGELLLAALRGLSRGGQKNRVQALVALADQALKPKSKRREVGRLRWELLKEAVKAGATPTTADGFHKHFEEVLASAYAGSPSLTGLLGRFKFREATTPLDGLSRLERVEKWLPFEVGRCFYLAGRGAGKVVETNFALDSVRVDFEKAKGIAIPIGVAAKSLVPLAEGHFFFDKLTNPATLAELLQLDPSAGLKRLLVSFEKPLVVSEVKEAVAGLVPEEKWSSWWTAARKNAHVVTHGSGKSMTVEWSETTEAADDTIFGKFERGTLREKLDFFKRHAKRSPDLVAKLTARLAEEADRRRTSDPAVAFEIAVLLEKSPDAPAGFTAEHLLPEEPLSFLPRIVDRAAREALLLLYLEKKPAEGLQLLADWLFKEEDSRTLDLIDRRLAEGDPALRERTLERLLRSPKSGPKAFVWMVPRLAADDAQKAKIGPAVLSRLLDAVSWDELGAQRTKVRELFDRTGLAAAWLMKQATVEEARTFLEALARHHELEPHRRAGLLAAAEMRFPELRKKERDDETFFVTPEAIEAKRKELEHILKVEIPENTKGIALAAAEGDLSENFEYKARRDKQQLLSARAGQLQDALTKARELDPAAIDPSEVRPGARVSLSSGASITLLGPWDSKPEEGVYSYLADVGKALLGKRVGDSAQVFGAEVVVEKIEVWR